MERTQMIEIIAIIGMMVLVINMTEMTKEEIAEWFAETVGNTDPQNPIDHLRCQAGKWMRSTTDKFSFCSLNDLVTEGFGLPGYFVQREGWETKKVLICRNAETQQWELISCGAIKVLEGKIRELFAGSDFEMFKVSRDGTMIWFEMNPEFVKDDEKIQSLQFTFDRKKKGHDGTEQTAPYILSKKGIIVNSIPAV